MRQSHFLFALVVACTALGMACSDEGESPPGLGASEPTFEPASGSRSTEPPAGSNGMLPACFWAVGSQKALRALGNTALHQGGGALPSVSLADVPQGCRHVLAKAIECALPQGQTLTDPVTSEVYEGWWGLAPSWHDAPLDTSGRRYVTACMVESLNAAGLEVPILLEGPNPAIQTDPELAAVYTIQESTAVGDLFSSTTLLDGLLPAFKVSVCWEGLLPQTCNGLGLPLLEQRICDGAPLCGFVPIGPCSLACVPNGPYRACPPAPLAPAWTQTVRVRLDPGTCQ